MADADAALTALRESRVKLFEACRERDKLLARRPTPVPLVVAANAEIELLRAAVQAARAAAAAALGE